MSDASSSRSQRTARPPPARRRPPRTPAPCPAGKAQGSAGRSHPSPRAGVRNLRPATPRVRGGPRAAAGAPVPGSPPRASRARHRTPAAPHADPNSCCGSAPAGAPPDPSLGPPRRRTAGAARTRTSPASTPPHRSPIARSPGAAECHDGRRTPARAPPPRARDARTRRLSPPEGSGAASSTNARRPSIGDRRRRDGGRRTRFRGRCRTRDATIPASRPDPP